MSVSPNAPRYPLWSPDPVDTTRGLAPSTTRRTGVAALPAATVGGQSTFLNPPAPTGGDVYSRLLPILKKAGYNDEEAASYIAFLEQQQEAFKASSGFSNRQLDWQIADAKRSREQAWKQAQLVADTSRYGTDAQSQTAANSLAETARQFDANHGLEIQRFGLDTAKTAVQFMQTPDQGWAMNDLKGALGRVGLGQSPEPLGADGSPHAKTWDDFAALSNYGGAGGGAAAAGNGGKPADLRLKAVKGIMEAAPPSDGVGHDDQDWAALGAIQNLYFTGRPGEVERLGGPRRKIAQAGLARLGYDPAAVEYDRQRALPHQGSTRAA